MEQRGCGGLHPAASDEGEGGGGGGAERTPSLFCIKCKQPACEGNTQGCCDNTDCLQLYHLNCLPEGAVEIKWEEETWLRQYCFDPAAVPRPVGNSKKWVPRRRGSHRQKHKKPANEPTIGARRERRTARPLPPCYRG